MHNHKSCTFQFCATIENWYESLDLLLSFCDATYFKYTSANAFNGSNYPAIAWLCDYIFGGRLCVCVTNQCVGHDIFRINDHWNGKTERPVTKYYVVTVYHGQIFLRSISNIFSRLITDFEVHVTATTFMWAYATNISNANRFVFLLRSNSKIWIHHIIWDSACSPSNS